MRVGDFNISTSLYTPQLSLHLTLCSVLRDSIGYVGCQWYAVYTVSHCIPAVKLPEKIVQETLMCRHKIRIAIYNRFRAILCTGSVICHLTNARTETTTHVSVTFMYDNTIIDDAKLRHEVDI